MSAPGRPAADDDDAPTPAPAVWTVGHGCLLPEALLRILRGAGIGAVVDLRTGASSRLAPWFDGPALRAMLAAERIGYLALGEQLGDRPEHAFAYDPDGHVAFERLAAAPATVAGIGRLERVVGLGRRVALLCHEEDPARCHRLHLVGRLIEARGATLRHLRSDGRDQDEQDLVRGIRALPEPVRARYEAAWFLRRSFDAVRPGDPGWRDRSSPGG